MAEQLTPLELIEIRDALDGIREVRRENVMTETHLAEGERDEYFLDYNRRELARVSVIIDKVQALIEECSRSGRNVGVV